MTDEQFKALLALLERIAVALEVGNSGDYTMNMQEMLNVMHKRVEQTEEQLRLEQKRYAVQSEPMA